MRRIDYLMQAPMRLAELLEMCQRDGVLAHSCPYYLAFPMSKPAGGAYAWESWLLEEFSAPDLIASEIGDMAAELDCIAEASADASGEGE